MPIDYHNPRIVIWTVCGILVALCGVTSSLDMLVSNDKMTWISARDYCQENNGSLIVLDSQYKWDSFTVENQLCHGGQLANGSYWIGLNTSTDTCQDYHWVNNNPATWTNWDSVTGQPNSCTSRKCVKIKDNVMRTAICHNSWRVLCEIDSNLTCLSPVGSTDVSLTTDDVLHTTETSTMESTTTSNDDVSHMTSHDDVIQNTTSTSDYNTASNTTVSYDAYTTTTTTSNDVEHTTEIDDVVHTTTAMRCCCTETNLTQLTPEQLQQITTVLKEKLTVLKSNTSVNRRKLISVYDSRPSSVAIGTLGCAILLLVLCLIVVPDLFCLVSSFKHVNGKTVVKHNKPVFKMKSSSV